MYADVEPILVNVIQLQSIAYIWNIHFMRFSGCLSGAVIKGDVP